MDPQIDIPRLRRLSALSQKKLNEVDATFQHGHEIASIHQKHQPPAGRVGLDAVVREAVDRKEK